MKQCKGIYLPDDDDHFTHHLERGPLFDGKGTYQFKKIEAALERLPVDQRGFAIDVGAHVGLWSRVLAAYFERVVAFEPFPHLAECWHANVKAENVAFHQVALGEVDGQLPMIHVKGNSGNARVATAAERERGKHILHAAVWRLDDLKFERKLDFLKIDVEGWELHVVRGGVELLKRDKPLVVVEQKKGNAERYEEPRTGALNFLQGLGYRLVWEISGDYCLKHPEA